MSLLTQVIDFFISIPPGIAGGLISGMVTLVAAGVLTWRLDRGLKSAEFVLGFTHRYNEILNERHRLNRQFAETRQKGPPTKGTIELELADAEDFYRQFFGLMLDEFFAYRKHLLDQDIFTEWM